MTNVPVTSCFGDTDTLLSEWAAAGLNVASGIKGQICTVELRLVRKVVGHITASDRAILDTMLRRWLNL